MATLGYRVETLAPIVIGRSMADRNMVYSMGYVTGTSVWGMLAGIYIKKVLTSSQNAERDELFQRWFLRGSLSFGPAFPKDKRVGEYLLAKPVPLCVQKDKNGEYFNLLEGDDPEEKTKVAGGYYVLEKNKLYFHSADTVIQFHHQREKLAGRSKDGSLYNYEAMNAEQLFTGQIKGSKADLEKFLEVFGNSLEGGLGASRNTQYGRVKIYFDHCEEDNPEVETQPLLSLVCDSPVILVNEQGFPDVSAGNLQRVLGAKIGELEIKQTFARTDEVDTFVSKWQAKKPLELCLVPGTVLQIKLKGPDSETWERLKGVLANGIGERRGEGFGRIAIMSFTDDPTPDQLTIQPTTKKPSGSMPKVVRPVFQKAAQDLINTEIFSLTSGGISSDSKSMLANLEMLLKGLKESGLQGLDTRFKAKLTELTNKNITAKKKLSAAEFNNQELIEYLSETTARQISDIILAQNEKIAELLHLVDIDEQKEEFQQEIYLKFLMNLCRISRKKISQKERAGGGENDE